MADCHKICLTVFKYGTFLVAFLAIFITELLILTRPPQNRETEDYITNVRYPSFFRTLEEQKQFINYTKRSNNVDWCCAGNTTWVTPPKMLDVTGTMRDMAQFKQKKQFFKKMTCNKRRKDCKCKCFAEVQLVSGVYVENAILFKTHHVGTFMAESCCKCI